MLTREFHERGFANNCGAMKQEQTCGPDESPYRSTEKFVKQ